MSTLVKSARKDHGRCFSCGTQILKGQSYYHYSANRFAQTFAWHAGCPAPTAGQMESNETRQIAMLGAESAYDDLDRLEATEFRTVDAETVVVDIKGILEAFAAELESAAESAREKVSNIEDGFGHETDRSNELAEWADTYENLASEIENWYPESNWEDFVSSNTVEGEEPDLELIAQDFLTEVLESARDAINSAEGEFP